MSCTTFIHNCFNHIPPPVFLILYHKKDNYSILNTLNSNGIKLDFIVSPCDSPKWRENFNFLKLGDYKFCIAVPINHPLAKKDKISFEDLSGEKVTAITTGDSKQNQDIMEFFMIKSQQKML